MPTDTMTMPAGLSKAAQFFWRNAGYSYDPKTETAAQGRERCARSLAAAESVLLEAMRVSEVQCVWEDESPWELGYKRGKDFEQTCEHACICSEAHGALASLGGITDAGTSYRRVIRAELACECIENLRSIIAAAE